MAAAEPDTIATLSQLVSESEPETSIDLRYFVLFTEPMRECKASDYLEDQGFKPWVPMYERTMIRHVRRYGRSEPRSSKRQWPIFSGYLFLQMNMAWQFGPIERCPYLRRQGSKFMTYQGRYKTLSEKDVSDIQGIERIANFREAYKIGDEVTVLSGPFAERVAKIRQLDDANRIALLMDIFGRDTTIFASASQIIKVQ